LPEIPLGGPEMNCPGCDQAMEKGGLVGAWIDNTGRYRGSYVLCSGCSALARTGTDAERAGLTERIEAALLLAEASPSREVH
jgi:hypothetical protein